MTVLIVLLALTTAACGIELLYRGRRTRGPSDAAGRRAQGIGSILTVLAFLLLLGTAGLRQHQIGDSNATTSALLTVGAVMIALLFVRSSVDAGRHQTAVVASGLLALWLVPVGGWVPAACQLSVTLAAAYFAYRSLKRPGETAGDPANRTANGPMTMGLFVVLGMTFSFLAVPADTSVRIVRLTKPSVDLTQQPLSLQLAALLLAMACAATIRAEQLIVSGITASAGAVLCLQAAAHLAAGTDARSESLIAVPVTAAATAIVAMWWSQSVERKRDTAPLED